MLKFLVIVLFCASNAALAQPPAANRMPDGSRDLYLGVGVESLPRYEGSSEQRTAAVPAWQMQWSNGIFIAGLGAGMHLSSTPGIEYGPLFAVEPSRNNASAQVVDVAPPPEIARVINTVIISQAQLQDVGARPELGGFFNLYFSPTARLATSVLYGSGENRKGIIIQADAQKSFRLADHHSIALTAGLSWANTEYMQSYYGVPPGIIINTPADPGVYLAQGYGASAGIKDSHLGVHWNWELSNSWLLTSQASATRLSGSAADSPLVGKRDNVTISTALAYRF